MKGKESKCAAVRLEKSRLMAAMAILAVAFVVLAAVPAVMTESDGEAAASKNTTDSGSDKSGTLNISTATDLTSLATNGVINVSSSKLTLNLKADIGSESSPVDVSFYLRGDLTIQSDTGKKYSLYLKSQQEVVEGFGLNFYYAAANAKVTITSADLHTDVACSQKTNAILQTWTTGAEMILSSSTVTMKMTGTGANAFSTSSTNFIKMTVNDSQLTMTGTKINAENVQLIANQSSSKTSTITMTDVGEGFELLTGSNVNNLTYSVNGAQKGGLSLSGTIGVTNSTFTISDINKAKSTGQEAITLDLTAAVALTMDNSSTITAPSIKVNGSTNTAKIEKGTLAVSQLMAASSTVKVLTLADVTLGTDMEVAPGATLNIEAAKNLVVAEGKTLTFEKPTTQAPAVKSVMTAGDEAILQLFDESKLVIEDINVTVDTKKQEKVTFSSEGKTKMTFSDPVTDGTIKDAVIDRVVSTEASTLTVKGFVPIQPTETLTVKTGLKGDIALLNYLGRGTLKITGNGSFSGDLKSWGIVNGNLSTTASATVSNIKAPFTDDGSKYVNITAGSLLFSGTFQGSADSSDVAQINGDSSAGRVRISDATTLESGTLVLGRYVNIDNVLTIASGAKLQIASGADVQVDGSYSSKYINVLGSLVIKGTLKAATADDTIVYGSGEVDVQAGATITGVGFNSGTTVVIDESVMNEKRESGEVSTGPTIYPQNQIVVIDGTWTLVPGAVVTIKGKLSVPEGSKVVVEEGAQLILDGSAVAEIEGSIEVADESATVPTAGVFDIRNGTANILGSAVINGKLLISDAKATVEVGQDAVLTISDEGILDWDAAGEIIVDASGTMIMNGQFLGAATILNYGLVTIDSDVPSDDDQTVKLVADGAVVDVVKFTVDANDIETLIITDAGLQATSYREGGETKYVTIEKTDGSEDSKADSIVITPGVNNITTNATGQVYLSFTGFTASVSVSSSAVKAGTANDLDGGIYNLKKYTKTVSISGSFDASYVKTDKTGSMIGTNAYAKSGIALTNGYVAGTSGFSQVGFKVSDSVSIADHVTMTNSTGKLSVTGSIATASKDASFAAAASGAITDVSGNGAITTVGQIIQTSENGVSAAKYETSVKDSTGATVKTYHYVSIDVAIVAADGTDVKEIIVLGTQTVKTTATLAAGVALNGLNSAVLNIGASAGADVTLTVAEGASVKGSMTVNVNGTLFAENKKDVKIASSVVSDVYSEEIGEDGKAVKEGWAQWTNLAAALASGAGQTITISKTSGNVEIKSNLTIPAGTTVVVPEDKASLKLSDGVTLTIDGTLKTSKDIIAEHRFAVNAMDISGTAESSTIVVNGMLMVADNLSMTIGSGDASGSATSFLASAPVYGAYYTIQDWKIVTTIDQALTETDITSAAITVYGPVVGSDGTVTANDTFKGITVSATEFTPVNNGTAVKTSLTMTSLTLEKGASITMTGPYTGSVVVGENSVQFTDVSGTINAANSSDALVLTGTTTLVYTKALTVSVGTVSLGTSDVAFDYVDSDTYSPMYIASGATAKVVKVTDIDNLSVSGTLEVPAGKTLTVGTLTVYGSVLTAASTDTTAAGSLTVGTAYVGITEYDFYKYSTGASASVAGPLSVTKMFVVSGATVDQDLSGYKKTEVYNNGSLWFTAYGKDSTQTMKLNKAPLSNAVLSGWATSEGGDVYYKTTDSIYIGSYGKIYSVVNTQIYTIIIKADTGIGDLYLNGNIMQKGTINDDGMYYSAFWATVSYGTYEVTCKLANGYSGTAVLKDSTGATVSANKFTTPEASEVTQVDFQLTGIEKSGYVQPTEEKKDSGLTVTDYLLIVLVILVVVLAVIVAMRLMRS